MKPDLSSEPPHDVAGLLKLYFRELPEPLLTFEMYEPFLAAAGMLFLLIISVFNCFHYFYFILFLVILSVFILLSIIFYFFAVRVFKYLFVYFFRNA